MHCVGEKWASTRHYGRPGPGHLTANVNRVPAKAPLPLRRIKAWTTSRSIGKGRDWSTKNRLTRLILQVNCVVPSFSSCPSIWNSSEGTLSGTLHPSACRAHNKRALPRLASLYCFLLSATPGILFAPPNFRLDNYSHLRRPPVSCRLHILSCSGSIPLGAVVMSGRRESLSVPDQPDSAVKDPGAHELGRLFSFMLLDSRWSPFPNKIVLCTNTTFCRFLRV